MREYICDGLKELEHEGLILALWWDVLRCVVGFIEVCRRVPGVTESGGQADNINPCYHYPANQYSLITV